MRKLLQKLRVWTTLKASRSSSTLQVSGNVILSSWTAIGFGDNISHTATTALEVNGTVSATNFVGDGSGLTNVGTGNLSETIAINDLSDASSTVASGNFLLGYNTGALISGSTHNNLAISLGDVMLNATGSNNTTVGIGSLVANRTGSGNTVYGFDAMYNNTTGNNNTAVGMTALINNISGTNNTAIGTSALINNRGGYNNTAVGLESLFNSRGYENTAIGFQAGYDLTGGDGNIFIGSSVAAPASAFGFMNIGNTLFGDLNGNHGRLGGTARIGINYVTPSVALEVSGHHQRHPLRRRRLSPLRHQRCRQRAGPHQQHQQRSWCVRPVRGHGVVHARQHAASRLPAPDARLRRTRRFHHRAGFRHGRIFQRQRRHRHHQPLSKLEVYGTGTGSTAARLSLNEGGVRQWLLGAGMTTSGKFSINNGSTGVDAMTIDSSSNVGIGTTDSTAKLDVNGQVSATSLYLGQAATGDKINLYKNTFGIGVESSNLTNWSSSQFRWRIGGTSVSAGTEYMSLNSTGLSVVGNVTAAAFLHSSDIRLKDNIRIVSDSLGLLQNLRGVHFTWKKDGKPAYGVIAQDVRKVMPEAVEADVSGTLSVEYDQLIAPLIEAVKELKADNDNLRGELNALRGDISAMKSGRPFVINRKAAGH